MMIQREVFEKMKDHVPSYKEQGKKWGYFQDPIEDNMLLSEDYFFCKKWRELGGEVMIDPTIRLGHIGSTEYAS